MALRGAAISLSDLLQCEAALIGNSVRGGTAIRELVLPGGSSRVWPDAARNLAARIGAAGVRVGAALNGFPALFI
ncbi:MAG: hypothetical protein BWZ10_02119 [candidate division BRC1 bacterium ADurb.BinA364]|nr:MAG: hypothetical protein BWZ10_02119 [candidate division BRC1 bacterium ADurb.BinA364]